jgi:glycosyltransferase involved in cell wall biosynthesis
MNGSLPGLRRGEHATSQPELSVVIPVFNEQATLSELYRRLSDQLREITPHHEILFVDDGSGDGSLPLLLQLHDQDPCVKIVTFTRNFGHQPALTAGLEHASGQAVVCMDADLQDPPEMVPTLVEKWREGFEVVYAIRRRRKESMFKRAAYRIFYRIQARLANIPIALDSGDFALLDRRVVNMLNRLPERNRFIRGLRTWVGLRQTGVEYERERRFAGKSKYTFTRMTRLALDGLFSFSGVPLRLVSLMGIATAIIALGGIGAVLYFRIFTDRAIPGWAGTVIPVLGIGGIQLLALGILGEYVIRIFDEVKRRPVYLVDRTIGFEEASVTTAQNDEVARRG